MQPLTVDQIGRYSLHDAIVNRLRDMIITGEMPPGSKINEAQICTRLGVSRTPLREALKFLASEGLVELVPRRGAVVKKFTAKETSDMLEVIKSLEQLAGERACALASDEGIAEIRRLHDEMIAAYQSGDRLNYYKLNQNIHLSIVALADNSALSDVHSILQTRLKRIRFVGHEGPVKWAAAVAEHVEMIEALEARDAERLKEVIGRHLTQAWVRVRDVASV
ncbi:GntR family transcriptional regulator [Falsochrobactrum ovis]|uniref:DNA-binding GntR family transcriptional regulator n=1 Tax=Falsochrobactrum ovis TaxID=1293442 RepID=A0A364JX53_9HYPH|nr:GntR family transcriptional regulator [Falsochrobactrum ovis]RAK31176.1 DNA-binding GntR family transcriptional regulator [Falsochrobactrum ovis]